MVEIISALFVVGMAAAATGFAIAHIEEDMLRREHQARIDAEYAAYLASQITYSERTGFDGVWS